MFVSAQLCVQSDQRCVCCRVISSVWLVTDNNCILVRDAEYTSTPPSDNEQSAHLYMCVPSVKI